MELTDLAEQKSKTGDKIIASVINDNFWSRTTTPGRIISYLGIKYKEGMFAKESGNPKDRYHYYLIITKNGRVCNFEKDIKVVN